MYRPSTRQRFVEVAAWLGHSPNEHLKTYAHATLGDRAELDYGPMLPSPVGVSSWDLGAVVAEEPVR